MPSRSPHQRSLLLEGRVRGLGHRGEAAVETERGVVFVAGALPRERIRLRPLSTRRGAMRGELVSVLEPAAERVSPPCAHSARCGGCPWMIWSVDAQRELKRTWVAQAVAAFAVPDVVVDIEASPAPLGYRQRARLAFEVRGRARHLGYRPPRGSDVVDVQRCPVLDQTLQKGYFFARERVLPLLSGGGEIWLAHSGASRPLLWLRCQQPQSEGLYAGLRALVKAGDLAGAALAVGDAGPAAAFGDPCQVLTAADGLPMSSPPFGFTQSNGAVNHALVRWVARAADPAGKHVLELFCGHGNFTVLLAPQAASYVAVERDPAAAQACRDNLASRGLSSPQVLTGDAALAPGLRAVDVVVLDPPRTGAKEVLGPLLQLSSSTVVYVSCDPATLRRDLSVLHRGGYWVDAARAFDMFPQTSHVEAAVRLRRGVQTGTAG